MPATIRRWRPRPSRVSVVAAPRPVGDVRFFAAARVVAGVDVDEIGSGRADVLLDASLCAPLPSATIVITAATPMIMPSIVRSVRSLWRLKPANREADAREQHALLVPERLDRIELRRLPRGIPAEEDADGRGDATDSTTAPGEIVVDHRR